MVLWVGAAPPGLLSKPLSGAVLLGASSSSSSSSDQLRLSSESSSSSSVLAAAFSGSPWEHALLWGCSSLAQGPGLALQSVISTLVGTMLTKLFSVSMTWREGRARQNEQERAGSTCSSFPQSVEP